MVSVDGAKQCESMNFRFFDFAVLVFSLLSLLSDLFTDIVIVFQYGYQGYNAWTITTFTLIFFPSLIVQYFSIRWYISDKSATKFHWIYHFFMLGIIYRYILLIKNGYRAFRFKSTLDIKRVYLEQSDLCILHLFESFLESSPQLVLQVYIILTLNEWHFWTGLSVLGSLLSLSWALASYSKTQRQARPNKKCCSRTGLLLQAVWNSGMLLARIIALVLCAYCFGNYVFIFVTIHWVAMTIWIIYQKTDFCDYFWDERIYNGVVGVIYCFCYFNLQEGKSRWRMLTFHLIIIFQNLSILTIFLMWFSNGSPKLAITSFIAIVGGTFIGVVSMLVYYRFYHPSGPIKFSLKLHKSKSQSIDYCTMTLRSLKQLRSDFHHNAIMTEPAIQSDSKEPLNPLTPDSIVVIEEEGDKIGGDADDEDNDLKTLREWISSGDDYIPNSKSEAKICESPAGVEKDDEALKRRAVCSTPHLVKLFEGKVAMTENEENTKVNGTDEAYSEVLSARDYENLCAVNICRDALGLRSWRGYSDIETWLHDDSVANDGCHDAFTTTASTATWASSEISCGTTLAKSGTKFDDHGELSGAMTESDAELFDSRLIDLLPVSYPLGTLDPIYEEEAEEEEDASTDTELSEGKNSREKAVSSLVATIDEITHNTPVSSRYRTPPLKSRSDFFLVRAVPGKIISS